MSATDRIPLVDLRAAHDEVAEEIEAGFKRVLAETAFIGGAEVAAFEREYAAFCGVAQCVGVANGTDAIELALRAVGVGRGDEVVIPANTFIATAEAVSRTGATSLPRLSMRIPSGSRVTAITSSSRMCAAAAPPRATSIPFVTRAKTARKPSHGCAHMPHATAASACTDFRIRA